MDPIKTPADSKASTVVDNATGVVTITDRVPPSSSTTRKLAASFHESLPGYVLIGPPRGGAQGIVFRAVQTATGRDVAIKLLHGGARARPHDRERFHREIDALAHLRHPGIVTIHDGGVAADTEYFVMDFVDGLPLDEYVERRALPLGDTVRLFAAVCDAVSAAHRHQRRFVHRDLKPGNIRVTSDGLPHVLDFGLARASDADETAVTAAGQPVGTFVYMSPEQAGGQTDALDPRSDVYTLGVILYKLLTGNFPYDARREGLISRIQNDSPVAPRRYRGDIPRDIEMILLKCLHKDPRHRYTDAGELRDDLNRFLSNEPVEARSTSRAYVWRRKLLLVAGRRRMHACAAAILGIVILVSNCERWICGPTAWHDWFAGFVERLNATDLAFTPYEQVRVIAIRDLGSLVQLAHRHGLRDASLEDITTLRPLHGLLMEKLSTSGAAVVGWDILFESDAAGDEAFVKGMRALNAAGIRVVLPLRSWRLDENARPPYSRLIAAEDYVKYGAVTCNTTAPTWLIDLAAQRGSGRVQPSFAMWLVAGVRAPHAEPQITLDEELGGMTVDYECPDSGMPSLKRRIGSDHLEWAKVVRMAKVKPGEPEYGLVADDKIAIVVPRLGTAASRDGSSISYEDVIAATPQTVKGWFSGKAVVIGYVPESDTSALATIEAPGKLGDEWVAKCYANAAASATALENLTYASRIASVPQWPLILAVATAGCVLGVKRRRSLMSVAVIFTLASMLCIGALVAACYFQYICIPLPAFVALILAVGAGRLICYCHRQATGPAATALS